MTARTVWAGRVAAAACVGLSLSFLLRPFVDLAWVPPGGALHLVFAVVFAVIAGGLLLGRPWAYLSAQVGCLALLPAYPVGSVIGIAGILALLPPLGRRRTPSRVEPRTAALPAGPWVIAVAGRQVRLSAGVRLRRDLLPSLVPQGADGVVAEVTVHPHDPSRLGLTNRATGPWTATVAGARREILPNQTVLLAAGVRIDFGSVAGEVRAG